MNDEQPKPNPHAVHACNRRFVDAARASIRQMTGKQYPHLEAQLGALTGEAVVEFVRLLGDLQGSINQAKR